MREDDAFVDVGRSDGFVCLLEIFVEKGLLNL